MESIINQDVLKKRTLLQNPYAYIEDIDHSVFLAADKGTSRKRKEALKLMGNPYASLSDDEVRASISKSKQKTLSFSSLQNPYASLHNHSSQLAKMENPYAFINDEGASNNSNKLIANQSKSISQIEQMAKNVQKAIWVKRNAIWPNGVPSDPVKMLDPSIAFEDVIGYEFNTLDTLDDFSQGESFKIAGLIDQNNKKAYISNNFIPTVQRFTSAHELGHAILHNGIAGLHRDRGLNGEKLKEKRNKIEMDADKFAAFYLMPQKLLTKRFTQHFLTQDFNLTDDRIFALGYSGKINLHSKQIRLRDISKILASSEQYNGKNFVSLAKQFQVSIETMAIRLEELGLVKL